MNQKTKQQKNHFQKKMENKIALILAYAFPEIRESDPDRLVSVAIELEEATRPARK